MTRVCIPTHGHAHLDDRVCEHFGRAATFTVVDTEDGRVSVMANSSLHGGGQGYPPDLIARAGCMAVICTSMGPKAVAMFAERGIAVFLGASGTVADAVALWRSGRLTPATSETACQEHVGSGAGHGHHEAHGHAECGSAHR